MEIDKTAFGARIKQFALSNFLSLTDFASAVGVNVNGLHSNYFNGKSLPGVPFLMKLLEFDCNLNWLFTGEGAQKINRNVVSESSVAYTDKEQEIKLLKSRVGELELLLLKVDLSLKSLHSQIEQELNPEQEKTPSPDREGNRGMSMALQ